MRIRPLLVTVNGAILPQPYGGQAMQVMVNLDQQKLLARHLTPVDIHDILMKQYLVLPSGDIKIKQTDWIVLTNASPLEIEHFGDIPIKRQGNAFVYLRDVATVKLMGRVQQNAVLVNGKQTVIIVVMKSTEASTLDVVEGIKKMIPRAEQISPEGLRIRLLDDVIQQTMRTPTLMVEGNRTFGFGVNRTLKDIADNLLMTTAGSQQVDQIYWLDPRTGMSYPINVYTPQPQINSLNSIKTVPVDASSNSPNHHDVQLLGNLANLSATGTPGVITHGNIMPLFNIYVSAEGRDLGGVLADVQKIAKSMEHEKPRSAEIQIHGQAALMSDAYFELIFGLLTAVVLVYLLIVVNFQSWLDPFIIITALPGALAGIAWLLFLTYTRLSEPALTGAIMAMGTATANSILVVSYARERLQEHGDALWAAIEAGTTRFRPVLMTASAMIIGMVPMATGYSQNAPLGRAVIGGLFVATLFTLFFVPCVYAMIYQGRAGRLRKSAQPKPDYEEVLA
jgi:multidrug efflux pump subunit AcrB